MVFNATHTKRKLENYVKSHPRLRARELEYLYTTSQQLLAEDCSKGIQFLAMSGLPCTHSEVFPGLGGERDAETGSWKWQKHIEIIKP